MEEIISKNNEFIKKLIKLKQKKFRDLYSLALIEGEKNVLEAYDSNVVDTIVFTEKYKSSTLKLFNDKNIKKILVNKQIFDYISTEITPQQILAVVKIEKQIINYSPESNFLICDNVQNPGNLGAILRSALATNFKDIYLLNSVDAYNPKVLNASTGNLFKLNLYNVNLDDIKQLAKNKNIELCATTLNGINAFDFKCLSNKTYGIIMGNEGKGISNDLLNIATQKITIPMQNNVESLNVAVAASLLMYKFQGGK